MTDAQPADPVWKVKPDQYPDFDPVIEIWETMNGDLYFVTEKEPDGRVFGYVRLYSMPESAEWGYSHLPHIKTTYGPGMIWEVPRKNWRNIETYEEGLLVHVNPLRS